MPRKKRTPILKFPTRAQLKMPGSVLATDVVMWGIVDGDGQVPEFLAAKRAHAQIVLDSLPAPYRDHCSLSRVYVTIQVLEGRRKLPKRAAS